MHSKHSIIKFNLFLLLFASLLSGISFAFITRLFGVGFSSVLQFLLFVFSCAAAGIVIGLIAFLSTRLRLSGPSK